MTIPISALKYPVLDKLLAALDGMSDMEIELIKWISILCVDRNIRDIDSLLTNAMEYAERYSDPFFNEMYKILRYKIRKIQGKDDDTI